MDLETLQKTSLSIASERSVEVILQRIVSGLTQQSEIALARVWLIEPGDVCGVCPMARECGERSLCLHLAASAGSPRDSSQVWDRLDGAFRRFPLGVRKIGHIGATGSGIFVKDIAKDGRWIANGQWAHSEGICCFAGQPLVFRGQTLGVLGVFSRRALEEVEFTWLRLFADHAAVAISNSRAFAEIERLRARLEMENASLKEEIGGGPSFGNILGSSPKLTHALRQLALVAPTDATVLILGESGVGKELVAQAVHLQSRRSDKALVRVNCSAIPRELFESEFFGHMRGAFTGALRDRIGRFQLADGGTLFLDEVGEIPLELQGKLLRVLQEGQFERVGDERTRKVDVRIIAATNRDLRAEVAARRFREDLYFRLNVFPIEIPPLRERPEDIPPLVAHFVARAAQRLGVPTPSVSRAAMRYLREHSYPGNVRELEHMIERAVIAGQGRTLAFESNQVQEGPADREAPAKEIGEIQTEAEIRRFERDNLMLALERAERRVYGADGAAALLGIKPTTLLSRMKVMGIKR